MPKAVRFVFIAYLAISLVIVWLVWRDGYRSALERLAETGRIRVEQVAERLVDQLDRYRVLANLLAKDRRVISSLSAGEDAGAISPFLRDQVLAYGAERIELLDRAGTVVVSSDPPAGYVSRRGSSLVTAAFNGRLGTAHVLESRKRQFQFSRGVVRGQAPASGAVIVSADIATLEFEWNVVPEAIGFFDDDGVVFVSNRPSLLLRQEGAEVPDERFQPFPEHGRETIGVHEVWPFDGFDELPATALVISRPVPQIDMTARGFLDVAPARAAAGQRAWLAAAIMAVLGLAALLIAVWRRRVADRLAFEAAANTRLEARVEQRTAELRATQDQLVQASKMTALGQMYAGLSHELNQPLAAIRAFAENGARLLQLDRRSDAEGNLGEISAQVDRMTRIIKGLRGFARVEDELIEPVDFRTAVTEALALTQTSLSQSGVHLTTNLPGSAVMVRAGLVRLQQVVVNLLSNAADATVDRADRRVDLVLTEDAVLTVRDNGHGIEDTSRVFEPFYTTKELGTSKGLGLGLSISYGLIGSFGGVLTAENHAQGGALFTVRLPLAGERGSL
ncbi:MAG: ATP-binding protein [Pseudomonadota bacterium]